LDISISSDDINEKLDTENRATLENFNKNLAEIDESTLKIFDNTSRRLGNRERKSEQIEMKAISPVE